MTLVGDVGGFNGAVIVFPAVLLSFLTEKMYHKAIAEDIPVKDEAREQPSRPRHARDDSSTSKLDASEGGEGHHEASFSNGKIRQMTLDHKEQNSIMNEVAKIGKQKPPSYIMSCLDYCIRSSKMKRRKR